jgi:hypothetical protein
VHCLSGPIAGPCIALCATPWTGAGPLKYEDQAWAELLVLNVSRPTCSSISGNVPEWRYLRSHHPLSRFGGAFWPDCRLHPLINPPESSSLFLLSGLPYPFAVYRVRISEVGTPRRSCCSSSFLPSSLSLNSHLGAHRPGTHGTTLAPCADCPIGHAHRKTRHRPWHRPRLLPIPTAVAVAHR